MSRRHIDEEGGLYTVLTADEMLESDVSAEREARRTERGYVAPSAAAGFLRLALGPATVDTPFDQHDPLTRGFFRDLGPLRAAEPVVTPRAGARPRSRPESGSLEQLLREAGASDAPARPQLAGKAGAPPALVVAALRELAARSSEQLAARGEELAYLANALVSGASIEGRRLRPAEAIEHVLTCVSLGLELTSADPGSASAGADVLERYPCDGLFRLAAHRARQPDRDFGGEKPPASLKKVRGLLKALKV